MENCSRPNSTCTPLNNQQILEKQLTAFNSQLSHYDTISLSEMDGVKLMNRVDTKFLISTTQLTQLLTKASDYYRVVEIEGDKICPYTTIYYDTNDAEMYTMHHNGKLNRFKIRTRSYVNSGISFLEIKRKNNKGRTSKKRIKIANESFKSMVFDEKEHDFVQSISPYQTSALKPQLQNYFQRITLVDKQLTERVTIDFGLQFDKVATDIHKDVTGLVIVEMKQDGACKSYFRQFLNEMRVVPGSMSKYCLGMVLLNPDLKSNRFKKKIRKITKIINYVTN